MYQFKVQGSSGVYDVIIDKKESNLICRCTCNAGKNGMACRHQFEILSGNHDSIVSSNADLVKEIPGYIVDTVDGQLFLEYLTKCEQLERLKVEVPALKKQLSKILPI